jgi:hypothetical protein
MGPDLERLLNTGPFNIWTISDHSKSGLVGKSDVGCISLGDFNLIESKKSEASWVSKRTST